MLSIKSLFNQSPPHINIVKRHTALLMGQAIVLLFLAIVYVGLEFKATIMEVGVEKGVMSPLVLETSQDDAVLGSETETIPTPESTQNIVEEGVVEVTPTPSPFPKPSQKEYTIAVYGDSMEDTMGSGLEYLDHELTTRYPETTFHFYNYGMGSYNVLTPHDRDSHWLGLTHLVQEAQKITPHVYILAEIAPKRRGFGFGPNGINWEPATAYEHTGKIIEQLENAIGLSSALKVPLIDAYTPSLQEEKKEGRPELINSSDGIHPSVEGHEFIAKIIADTIELP